MQRLFLLLCLNIVFGDNNVPTNNSDVFITYAGHVEAYPERTTGNSGEIVPERTSTNITTECEATTMGINEPTPEAEETTIQYPSDDEVLFIPHEKEMERVEDEFYKTPMSISDILEKSMGDVMKKVENASPTQKPETPANPDILFITGKNAEEKEEIKTRKSQNEQHMDIETRRSGDRERIRKNKEVQRKLDCTNLYCSNNIKSVCGGKKENGRYKYRLFLNECFFRKVNCAFNYAENRYNEVPKERCSTVAVHLNARPTTTPIIPIPIAKNMTKWKSYSSRRTMNQEADGRFCSHPCPVSCPEDYDPECAMSKRGKRRVFVNHCKLDYNSCFYGEVWQRRPLSECVGGQKADLQHNRRFIAWMQRVGMVDKRGKLTL